MQIKKIKLRNIRKIKYGEYEFNKNINLILGPNAIGKTTVVEAIYYCCFLSSFRTKKTEDIITLGKKEAHIELIYFENKKEHTIKINFSKNKKKIFYDKREINKFLEVFSKINVLVISPSNIDLVDSSPKIRRHYLDQAISQVDQEYLKNLINYQKLLKIKNKYLKNNQIIDKIYYELITKELSKYNEKIVNKRILFIEELENNMNKTISQITENYEVIKLNYVQSSLNYKDIDSLLEQENKYKKTLIGSHLDDYEINLNEINLKRYGSQGQKRLVTISYFLGQNNLIYKKTNKKPIVIFDDVHLDLDNKRQERLFKYLKEENQLIYVTTDKSKIEFLLNYNPKILEINKE